MHTLFYHHATIANTSTMDILLYKKSMSLLFTHYERYHILSAYDIQKSSGFNQLYLDYSNVICWKISLKINKNKCNNVLAIKSSRKCN